jgi:hypothetical protein
LESAHIDFNIEFAQENSIPKLIATKFIISVIIIDCVFIETNKPTPRGQKFIHTFEMIFVIKAEFKHPNFSIKEGIVHLVFLFSFQYCYVVKSYQFLVGENEGKH